MRKRYRTPWIDIELQVAFEEAEMELFRRNGRHEKVTVVTPFFRLPDGTEFSGRRLDADLRKRIIQAGRQKGIR